MKRKRILSLALAAAMIFGSAAALPEGVFSDQTEITASASFETEGDYEYYASYDGTAKIWKYTGSDTNVVIPSEINGYTVTEIYNEALYYAESDIISITIPSSITNIEIGSFEHCSSLKEINVDSESTTYCSIDGILYDKEKATLIACPRCKTEIVFPKSVTSIEEKAFYCSELETIDIPSSVTSIGDFAFCDCTKLRNITIPSSVTSIGDSAFSSTEWLENQQEKSPFVIVNDIFIDGRNCEGEIHIPDDVKVIGDGAFKYSSLTGIILPNSVKSIGHHAFCDSSLESITIPSSVTSIGDHAFYSCNSLTSVTLPNSIKRISEYMFSECTSLPSITIPSSVTSIDFNAFSGCDSLKQIEIPSSVTIIDGYAFEDCKSLESVSLSEGLEVIANDAFNNCEKLNSITIPRSVTTIMGYAFGYVDKEEDYMVYSVKKDDFKIYCYSHTRAEEYAQGKDNGKNVEFEYEYLDPEIAYWDVYDNEQNNGYIISGYRGKDANLVVPSSIEEKKVVSIGDYALMSDEFFGTDYSFIKSIAIPNTVSSLGVCSFAKCKNLSSVSIPNSITSIGDSAFLGCESLSSVTIPESVTYYGNSLFLDCTGLKKVNLPNNLTSIVYAEFGNCKSLKNITIPSKVKSIEPWAFSECSNLEKVEIPDSVTSIGVLAFGHCDNLKKVEIPKSVNKIDSMAFGYASTGKQTDFVIYCYSNSTAEQYAKDNGFKYVLLDKPKLIDISDATVTLSKTSYIFDGKAKKPAVTVKLGTKTLVNGTDYTVAYKNNVKIGTATVTVTGKGNYTGTVSKTFKIVGKSIADAEVTLSKTSYAYDGKAKKPAVTVVLGTKTLVNGTDYTVTYKNNVNAGTATVTVTGAGNYTGSISKTFKIVGNSIADAKVTLSKTSYTYDGKAKKPAVTVKLGTKTLVKGTDYTVAYKNNVKAGTATVTVTGNGNYAGTVSKTFKIVGMSISSATVTLSKTSYTYDGKAKKPAVTVKLGTKTLVNGTDYTVAYKNNVKAGTATVTVTGKGNYKGTVSKTFKIVSTADDSKNYEYEVLDNGTVMITGYKGKASELVIPSTLGGKKVTKINSFAFDQYTGTKITVPNSVTSIGSYAFSSCENLETVILPSNLKSISDGLFNFSSKLKNVNIPNSVTSIGDYAFAECYDIEKINIPSGVNKIGQGAFYSTAWLDNRESKNPLVIVNNILITGRYAKGKVTIPNTVKSMSKGVFDGAYNITSVVIPKSITSIPEEAFSFMYNLNSVTIPEGIKTIGQNAFIGCANLKTVTIPKSVTKIGEKALGYEVENTYFGFTIRCYKGSAAEKYAKANNIDYTIIGASAPTTSRLAGDNRYATAGIISKKMYPKTSDTVIIATGITYQDALVAVPLASVYNAPLLLATERHITAQTEAELKRLKAKNVIVVSTNGAIGSGAKAELKALGLKVTYIEGKTCFETAAKVAKALQAKTKKAPDTIFFATDSAFADALSASPVAAIKNAPIIYLKNTGSIDKATADYLKSVKGKVKNAYIIGGDGVISNAMMKNVAKALGLTVNKTVQRLAGANRYETCVAVNKKFKSVLSSDGICVAKGLDFPDALAGGVYAAATKQALFLADGKKLQDCQNTYLKGKNASKITIFGGTGAVPDSLVKLIAKASV